MVWILGSWVVLLVVGFFAVEPAIGLLSDGRPTTLRRFDGSTPRETVLQRSFEALTVAWFFMLGASFGSFLHCVEYRMPRGISIVARGSSCPGCGSRILMWHNVPVLGWLLLRGRCASCRWPIPARYAVTEFLFGLAFVLLMAVELVGGGMNLPLRPWPTAMGTVQTVWTPRGDLIALFAYHATLITCLFTCTLFALDRVHVPRSLLGVAVALGLLAPLVSPQLQGVPWHIELVEAGFIDQVGGAATGAGDGRLHALLTAAFGASAGLALAAAKTRRRSGNVRHADRATLGVALVLVGLFLGWQAAVGIACVATLLRWFAVVTPGHRWPVALWVTAGALIHTLLWRWFASLPFWPGRPDAWVASLAGVFIVVAASRFLDRFESGGDAGPPELAAAFPAEANSSIEGVATATVESPPSPAASPEFPAP
jgi:prepilin signal peptidase PulO-like enzyme (type II secretory pathway)